MLRQRRYLGTHLIAAGLFALSLGMYLSTAAPTLTWRNLGVDGGELLAAAYNMGIPHPPGYPSYVLLVKLFATLVPVRDFAFRATLLSSTLSAITVVLLYYTVLHLARFLVRDGSGLRLQCPTVAAGLSATAFAVSPLFWSQATIAEVYSLNAFFSVALILAALRTCLPALSQPITDVQGSAPSWGLPLFALTLGLGLGNHLTLLLLAAPLVYWLGSTLGWRRLVHRQTVAALIVGLSVYLYLPIRASQTPPINWGDPDNIKGFLWMVTADPYQGYAFGLPRGDLLSRLTAWADQFFRQFNPLGVFLGLAGALYLWKVLPGCLTATAVSLIALSAYSIGYNTADSTVYMIPGFLVFSLWMGVGFYWFLAEGVQPLIERGTIAARYRPAVFLVVATFLLVPGASLLLNYRSQDISSDYAAYDHAKELIGAVGQRSIVLADSEEDVFGLWYMRYVEYRDIDVMVVAVRLLQYNWYWQDLHTQFPDRVPAQMPSSVRQRIIGIADYNVGRVPTFVTYRDSTLAEAFSLKEEGSIYRLE